MSRKALFDFYCEDCGSTHERLVYPELTESLCGCGKMAKKALCAPRCKLESVTGAFPGAYHKWANEREARGRKSAQKAADQAREESS